MNFTIFPENAASFGPDIDHLAGLITVLGVTCLVLAEAVLFFALFRFRRKTGAAGRITGGPWLQARWVVIPVIVVLMLDLFIDSNNAHAWYLVKEYLPDKPATLRITGQQFSWSATYPGADGKFDTADDIHVINEIHVPVDQDVVFDLQAKDVLHSFWVPSFRLKQDAVPGRTIHGWFHATRTGRFDIACAQLCGTGHAKMAGTLVVESATDFQAWLTQQAAAAQADMPGARLAKAKSCTGCHSIDGSIIVGPSWKGLFGRTETILTNGVEHKVVVDEDYVRRHIWVRHVDVVKDFPDVMPEWKGKLTEDEANLIIDYIKTLK